MKGSTSEASIYFHVRTVRQNQRAARRAAAASKDAGFWSQNKKEARAKRVFVILFERSDKIFQPHECGAATAQSRWILEPPF